VRGGEKQHEQEVTHHHVHQQTQCQGDRPEDKRRDNFDRRHDDVERPGHSRGKQRVSGTPRVLAQTGIDKGQIGGDRQHQRHSNHTGASDIEPRYHSGEVHKQHQEEDAGNQREEALSVFLTAGHNPHLAGSQPEDQDQCHNRQQTHQNDAIHLKNGAFKENRGREKFLNRRGTESFTGC
jgi:hypothetical protein